MSNSLWGEDFQVSAPPAKQKKLIERVSKPKQVKVTTEKAVRIPKQKGEVTQSQLDDIALEVHRILGVYEENTVCLRSREELHNYIDAAILNNLICIDTETNNSLVPLTCKLMGLCLYTPGQKNAYIPVNHINLQTGQLLENQVTERDIKGELERLGDTFTVLHNGKFDYQVIKCTCNTEIRIDWDTMIAAHVLNENERAGLKGQYIQKIDPTIEKYDIEGLFEGIAYSKFSPELFALYAATDAYMTYKLYEWQKGQFEIPDHHKLYNLFKTVEMPLIPVLAEMELTGVAVDTEYAKRLSKKYHKKLDALDLKLDKAIHEYDDIIAKWRLTPDAQKREKKVNKRTGEETWSRSKSEQLPEVISVTSPVQLAILFYDVLGTPVIDKKSPRGTGEEILSQMNYPICKLILEKRGLEKLIGTYIDKLPECILPETGRIHCHFNQYGAGTGRLSSSDPNLQNIPSHNKDIRMMFSAGNIPDTKTVTDSSFTVTRYDEIETVNDGWKTPDKLAIGTDILTDGEEYALVSNVTAIDDNYTVYIVSQSYYNEVIAI